MKLTINYDLIKRIQEAKGEFVLQRCIERTFTDGLPTFLISNSLILTMGMLANIEPRIISETLIRANLGGIGFYLGSELLILEKFKKQLAELELLKLSLLLKDINVSTSYDLLLDTELYHTEYKLGNDENKFKGIIQNKYFDIPTYNDGKIETTSVKQEHILGSKQYVLSTGSPNKQKVLKPAFNAI